MARRSDTGKGGPPIAGGVGGDDRRASGAVTEAKDRVHPRVFRSDRSIRRIGYRFVYEVLHTWLRPGLAYAVSARLIGGSVDSPISFGIGAERVRIPMTATIRQFPPWAVAAGPGNPLAPPGRRPPQRGGTGTSREQMASSQF